MTRQRRLVALGALVALLLAFVVNTEVRGDGNGYYAWVASAVVDHDLDFRNQFRHGNRLFLRYYEDGAGGFSAERITRRGYVDNQWAVGPAVLWTPWFLAAHAIVKARGIDPQDGYAPLYLRFCAVGTLCYAALALWLSVLAARRFGASARVAWSSAVVVWGASSLLVYTFLLPFYAHAAGAFTVAAFLFSGLRSMDRSLSISAWAAWGALAGLMAMTYQPNAVFALVAVPVWVRAWRADGMPRAIAQAVAFGVAGVAAASPQLIAKGLVYGSPFQTGYHEAWFWSSPQLWRTAFSTNHGVLLWTPVVGVGVVGCIWLARREPLMVAMLVAAAVFYDVIASYGNWHGLSSFGNRFFTAWTFLVVIGVAKCGEAARQRARFRSAVAIGLVLVAWNFSLAFQWASKMIPNRGGVEIGVLVRQSVDVPARALSMGYRYFTDRAGLAREINERDEAEWASRKLP